VLAKLGSDAGIIQQPLPADDPRQRQPDITKARELLGWEPKVALSEGLDRTIAFFQEQLNGAGESASAQS
jgi:UDP-glucuronate decarboxylase